jgi:DNA-directed RNA polymerase subunit M/transcription elongation factor TFIIS
MGCMHTNTVKIGEARACLRCGYTIAPNRPPFYDKEIINYNSKKERKKANAKKS